MNLVLDNVQELINENQSSRNLGLVVLRGPTITVINPSDGTQEISNPFLQPSEWFRPQH